MTQVLPICDYDQSLAALGLFLLQRLFGLLIIAGRGRRIDVARLRGGGRVRGREALVEADVELAVLVAPVLGQLFVMLGVVRFAYFRRGNARHPARAGLRKRDRAPFRGAGPAWRPWS